MPKIPMDKKAKVVFIFSTVMIFKTWKGNMCNAISLFFLHTANLPSSLVSNHYTYVKDSNSLIFSLL